jgi:hypothetical protein
MPRTGSVNSESDLLLVSALPEELSSGIALAKLTAYSLFWMQEWGLRRTIESISVLNWRLFPHKFAMIGFPQLPDSLRTNRSLMQGQPKYQNLLTGTATRGFSLNQHGLVVAHDLVARLGEPRMASGVTTASESTMREIAAQQKDRARTIDPAKDVARIRDSVLFEKWRSTNITERDIIHVHTLLGIFEHTPGKVRRDIYRGLLESAVQGGDDEAERFLREVHRRFNVVFLAQ